MRLFLSSYRAGNHSRELQKLFGKKISVAVITNAKDYKNNAERIESVDDILKFLKDLNYKPSEIDLRSYFGNAEKLKKELRKYEAVWVAGGNTFILRRAFKYSGLDLILGDMVRKNEIIYAGESAGAILPTPSLHGAEYGDDPNDIPDGYDGEILWQGLNIINYHLIPHYGSAEFSDEPLRMEKYLSSRNLPYRTLSDNQVIIINNNKEEFLI
jgi:dipeptidase E